MALDRIQGGSATFPAGLTLSWLVHVECQDVQRHIACVTLNKNLFPIYGMMGSNRNL